MRVFIIIVVFALSCRSETSTNCATYEEGMKYFREHYHGDYMDNGSRDTVIAYLQRALKGGCKNFELYHMLYFCCQWNGDFHNAEKYISEAIKFDKGNDPELFYWKGEMNLRLNRLEDAKSDYNTYVSLPNALYLADGLYRIGVLQFVQGDTINSEINRHKAIELNKGKSLRDFKEFAEAWGLHK